MQGHIGHYEDLGFYSQWLRELHERATSRRVNALKGSFRKLLGPDSREENKVQGDT